MKFLKIFYIKLFHLLLVSSYLTLCFISLFVLPFTCKIRFVYTDVFFNRYQNKIFRWDFMTRFILHSVFLSRHKIINPMSIEICNISGLILYYWWLTFHYIIFTIGVSSFFTLFVCLVNLFYRFFSFPRSFYLVKNFILPSLFSFILLLKLFGYFRG